jgi:hypothetical protein
MVDCCRQENGLALIHRPILVQMGSSGAGPPLTPTVMTCVLVCLSTFFTPYSRHLRGPAIDARRLALASMTDLCA